MNSKTTNRLWTPEEDKHLKALIETSITLNLVAAKLQRSVSAVKNRAHVVKISIAWTGLKAKGEMTFANHHERQFMQRLRGAGWVKASTLPPSPRLVQNLLQKGWIEEQTQGPKNEVFLRLTEEGLKAKKLPVPVQQQRRTTTKSK